MAITALLVFAGRNRLRYKITSTAGAEAVTIAAAGAATPDLVTDTPNNGQLGKIVRASSTGYGKLAAAGVTTAAIARALVCSDDSVSVLGAGVPPALCQLQMRATDAAVGGYIVDASAPGNVLTITVTAAAIGVCYLDVYVGNMIGA